MPSYLKESKEKTVTLKHESKAYPIGATNKSLRDALSNAGRRLTGRVDDDGDNNILWALNDISFVLNRGESLGIIGPNGAGKTTMLKLLSKITVPTEGAIKTEGRISALIELGAGFHPDLTGRDNIYLSAALLGMTRAEIDSRFEKIVAFSELGRFLETPVKRYSSGMYARLGFSVAAHVNPDILLIDEVLAVGDVAFQSKCYQRMGELKKNGTTIIFVTHTMPTMRRLCDRAILLYQGKIQATGEPAHVVETYLSTEQFASNLSTQLDSNGQEPAISQKKSEGPVVISGVSLLNSDGMIVESCKNGDSLTIHIDYTATQETHSPSVTVKIRGSDGTLYDGFNSAWDGIKPEVIHGEGAFEISIDPICLLDGNYLISVMIADADGLELFDWHSRRYKLRVIGGASASSHGIIHMPHKWQWISESVNSN